MRLADRAVCIGPPPARESYLNQTQRHRRGRDDRLRRAAPGLRLPLREPVVRARLRGQRPDLRRPDRRVDGGPGRQVARQGRDARRRHAARAGLRGPAGGRGRGAARGGRGRLSRAAQGGVRRRRARHAPGRRALRAGGRVRDGDRGGPGGLRRRRAVPREDRRRRPPRRGAGARRRRRRRARPGRARVQRPAPPPEAARGVALAVPERRGARRSCTTPRSAPCARRATAMPARSSACSAAISRSTSWR